MRDMNVSDTAIDHHCYLLNEADVMIAGSKSVAQRVEEAVDRLVFVMSTMEMSV